MDQLPDYSDDRQRLPCAYCRGPAGTRDHVPSRVLLDEPFPANLPVVPSCRACNEETSADEEYVACLIECAVAGSTLAEEVRRPKIAQLLQEKPALAARLRSAQSGPREARSILPEAHRVRRVVMKLARGHSLFELALPQEEPPAKAWFAPFTVLDDATRSAFEALPNVGIWPEVGSRAMQRLARSPSGPEWLTVQPGRYRYSAFVEDTATVRIALSEYLACEVVWA